MRQARFSVGVQPPAYLHVVGDDPALRLPLNRPGADKIGAVAGLAGRLVAKEMAAAPKARLDLGEPSVPQRLPQVQPRPAVGKRAVGALSRHPPFIFRHSGLSTLST